jgi:hypothetical protein
LVHKKIALIDWSEYDRSFSITLSTQQKAPNFKHFPPEHAPGFRRDRNPNFPMEMATNYTITDDSLKNIFNNKKYVIKNVMNHKRDSP